jgi:glucose-1-phosphate adenylyltransferase
VIVVLFADHVLHLDVRQLVDAHGDLRADVTLVSLPLPVAEVTTRTVLGIGTDQRVHDVEQAPLVPACAPGLRGFAHAWVGDLVVSARAVPALLAAASRAELPHDAALLAPLADRLRLMAYDLLENRLPGSSRGNGAYWHEPTTIEGYYEAQMELCTPRPALDLYNTAWPVLPVGSDLGPAKVVADGAGRPGQALNSLVSDGSVISGGVAINTVLGCGVTIESMAEVEDCVLLDGCRIGRGARVRRAVVAAGAQVADGEEIGYGSTPAAPARIAPSGLVLVSSPATLAAAGIG